MRLLWRGTRQTTRGLTLLLPPVVLALCLWLLADRLAAIDVERLRAAMAAPGPLKWAGALAATALSFWAVARFERVTRSIVGLGGPDARAMRAGAVAVAIAQTVGFGIVSGALARWRMLPELGLARATALSAAVASGFVAALAVLTAGLLAALRPGQTGVVIGLAGVALTVVLRTRAIRRAPGLAPQPVAALLGWTALDVGAGALVLYLLLPATLAPAPLVLLAAYMVALLAGFLSQSPGGLGAFELTLIALLPAVPQDPLVAALVGYRLVYHLLPAICAVGLLWRPGRALAEPRLRVTAAGLTPPSAAPHGDWALLRGDDGHRAALSHDGHYGWLLAPAGPALAAIGLPMGGRPRPIWPIWLPGTARWQYCTRPMPAALPGPAPAAGPSSPSRARRSWSPTPFAPTAPPAGPCGASCARQPPQVCGCTVRPVRCRWTRWPASRRNGGAATGTSAAFPWAVSSPACWRGPASFWPGTGRC